MGDVAPVKVRVVKRLGVAVERAFDAWVDPVLIGQWMFGKRLREEEVLHVEVDARVGGRFSFLVRRGGREIDHVGTYLEMERPGRLVFTWGIAGESADESRVMVETSAVEGGSEVVLTHEMDGKWAAYAERVEGSWRKMLEAMGEVLAA